MKHACAVLLAAGLIACAAPPPSELDGDWLVQEIAGAGLNAEERIHFRIDGETMAGATGCNGFTARVTQFERTVTISNVVETDAACPSEAAATNEVRFLGVLPAVARFDRNGDQLELLAQSAAEPDALILARTDNLATLAE